MNWVAAETLLIVVITSFGGQIAKAGDRPAWVKSFPMTTGEFKNNSQYKFYRGISHPNSDERAAFDDALENARENAIEENFGTSDQVLSSSYGTTEQTTVIKNVSEESSKVYLQGFQIISSYTQTGDSGKKTVWVLCRYKVADILKEKLRLTEDKPLPISASLVSSSNLAKGNIQISTHPEGAYVTIDGRGYGYTPASIVGGFASGTHTLVLDSPDYKTITQKFSYVEGSDVQIPSVTLVPAQVAFKVSTSPANAKVIVNGQAAGFSPVTFKELAGSTIQLEISHPNTRWAIVDQFIVSKSPARQTKNYILPLKNGYLKLDVFPPTATILMDGINLGRVSKQKIPCVPGDHTLAVLAKHYGTANFGLRCYPKQTIQKEIKLKRWQIPQSSLGFYVGMQSSPLKGVDTAIESVGIFGQFHMLVPLEWVLAFNGGETQYSNGKLKLSGYEAKLGFPICFYQQHIRPKKKYENRFSVVPDMVYLNDSYSASYSMTDVQKSTPNYAQFGFGAGVQYTFAQMKTSKNTPVVANAEIGVDDFQSVAGIPGNISPQFGLSLGWGW